MLTASVWFYFLLFLSEASNCKALLILTQIPSALICICGKKKIKKIHKSFEKGGRNKTLP